MRTKSFLTLLTLIVSVFATSLFLQSCDKDLYFEENNEQQRFLDLEIANKVLYTQTVGQFTDGLIAAGISGGLSTLTGAFYMLKNTHI